MVKTWMDTKTEITKGSLLAYRLVVVYALIMLFKYGLTDYNVSGDIVIRVNDSLLDGNKSTLYTDLLSIKVATLTNFSTADFFYDNESVSIDYLFENVNDVNLININIVWDGYWENTSNLINDNITFYLYNGSGWELIHEQSYTNGTTVSIFVSDGLLSRFVNGGNVTLRLNDTLQVGDSINTTLKTDFLNFIGVYSGENVSINNIRGSSEIHVSNTTRALLVDDDVPVEFDMVVILLIILFILGVSLLFVDGALWWVFVLFVYVVGGLWLIGDVPNVFVGFVFFLSGGILLGAINKR